MITTSDASTTNWGACLGDIITGGDMVSTGDDAPHQLFGTLSSLPGSAMFSENREQYDHSSKVGQHASSTGWEELTPSF